ncbi:MAG: hypothetical protein II800_05385, partial [Lachnospiraceae bacterium]|nr:hypothetical protein [Lachnospiraceae bacterium]
GRTPAFQAGYVGSIPITCFFAAMRSPDNGASFLIPNVIYWQPEMSDIMDTIGRTCAEGAYHFPEK